MVICISEDGPGQETLIDDKPALPPGLEWLEELYEWVFLAFHVYTMKYKCICIHP